MRTADPLPRPALIVVARTRQDWLDVSSLVVDGARLGEECTIVDFDTEPLYREGEVVERRGASGAGVVVPGLNPFRAGYYGLDPFRRLILVLLNTIRLVSMARRHGAVAVVSAPPVAYVRVARCLSPRLRSIGYLRSAFPAPWKRWSTTERVESFFRRLRLPTPAFLNAYWSDRLLVAGTATARFLRARGLPMNTIRVVGPGRLGRQRSGTPRERPRDRRGTPPTRIVYLTQAFLRHGDALVHRQQLEAIGSLARWLERETPEVVLEIRLHPRDNEVAYDALQVAFPRIERSNGLPEAFLDRTASEDLVVVGLTSTLLFETAYLGGHAYSFGTRAAIAEYRWFFEALEIEPYDDPGRLWAEGICEGRSIERNAVSQVLAFPEDCDIAPFSDHFQTWLKQELGVPDRRDAWKTG